MSEENQTRLIHLLCAIVIGFCLWLALVPLRAEPLAGNILFGLAAWLYGKLTGKPAPPILNRIVAKMDPERVEQIMSQPPAAKE